MYGLLSQSVLVCVGGSFAKRMDDCELDLLECCDLLVRSVLLDACECDLTDGALHGTDVSGWLGVHW